MKHIPDEKIKAMHEAAFSLEDSLIFMRCFDTDLHSEYSYQYHYDNYRKQLGILNSLHAGLLAESEATDDTK